MKNFWLILITVIPLNILTGMSSSFPPELNQRPEICKTAFHGGKIFQGKKKSSSKRKNRSPILPILGIVSLAVLIISGLISGFSTVSLLGFMFFTLATGIGFVLSEKKGGSAKNKVPKALFIIAIIANVLFFASMLYFKNAF